MKKQLLFVALLAGTTCSAQSLTQANEPAIGETASLFLCDSFTVNLEGVTGSAVTWDYSAITGYFNETRDITVLDATLTAATDSFPGATKAIEVENTLTTYYSSTATERTSQGFLFNEPSFGDVYVMFKNDPETIVTYPFTTGNTLNDDFDGYVDLFYNVAIHESLTGSIDATVDGDGTLELPGTTITSVIRYKLVDTSYTTLPLLGNVELIRKQFEYYDVANSTLPVFIHTNLIIQPPGGSPLIENTIVLSSVLPAAFIGLDENEFANVQVAPNPVGDELTVYGDFSSPTKGLLVDQSGRILIQVDLQNGSKLDTSGLDSGSYIFRIENENGTTTRTVIKY